MNLFDSHRRHRTEQINESFVRLIRLRSTVPGDDRVTITMVSVETFHCVTGFKDVGDGVDADTFEGIVGSNVIVGVCVGWSYFDEGGIGMLRSGITALDDEFVDV